MEKTLHFLSESAIWETTSEFVTPTGEVSKGTGESIIKIDGDLIINESWAILQGRKIENNYKIERLSVNHYQYTSLNPTLGIQKGFFDISGSNVYSRFQIEGTELNGYEIIRRVNHTCFADGILYNGSEVINSWNALLNKRI